MAGLGLDTSNYTTSAAVFDTVPVGLTRHLSVPGGALGLRQQEALFQHVKALPELMEELGSAGQLSGITSVAASTRPREAEGSYMPCFLAGEGLGRSLSAALGVPFFAVSHQQGHMAAAAYGAGAPTLLDEPFLAWHLSGGTTELLLVAPEGRNVTAEAIGGTTDISAGQLIDRTGLRLGLSFPAGRALSSLAERSAEEKHFTVRLDGLYFSLSGVENQVAARLEGGGSPEDAARFILETLASVLIRATLAALQAHPNLPVLCAGGVAGSGLLRAKMKSACGACFAPPEFSADNAMGVAILAHRLGEVAV